MHFVKNKIPLLALAAALIGAMVVFGSTFTPRDSGEVLAADPLTNYVSCADIYFDVSLGALPSPNFGSPPQASGLLTAKAITRSDVSGGVVVQSTQALYLGEDTPGYEPAQTQFDFLLGEIIPDAGPTTMPCVDLTDIGETPPPGTPSGSKTLLANAAPEPIDHLTVKAGPVSNTRVTDYTVVSDTGDPRGINKSESCVWGGPFGWVKYETFTPIVAPNKGPKAVNYGETAIILGTDAPVGTADTNGDTKPDVATNPAECTNGTPMTSTFVAIARNAATDNPANVKAGVVLDPDGPNGGPIPLPQLPDGSVETTGTYLADDWDGDGCTDWDELSPTFEAGRDPFNPMDCTPNPSGIHNVLATVQATVKGICDGNGNVEYGGNPPEPSVDCKGEPAGTSVTVPGTYFHCITKIDKAGPGPGVVPLTATAQCYQDSPALGDVSQLLGPTPQDYVDRRGSRGSDGMSGPPPPPPYASQPPSLGAGTWDTSTNTAQLNICFVDLGGALMGPNIIADVTYNTVTTKGTVDIYRNQSISDCDTLTHQGTAFLAGVPIQFTKQAADFDHDDDNCTDSQELTVPAPTGCGDDPYNPYDGTKQANVIGTYDVTTTVTRADWDKVGGAPVSGLYYNCKLVVETQTPTGDPNIDDSTGQSSGYADAVGSPVNDDDPSADDGDGLRGSPPPYPLAEVPQKSTPATHVQMVGTVDKAANLIYTDFCQKDAEHGVNHVIINSVGDINTGLGTADIWLFNSLSACNAHAQDSGISLAVGAPAEAVRQDDDLSTDSDGDGCTDVQELGNNELAGGYRDPFNPWDYFDPTGDGAISGLDFFGVLGRFNTSGTVSNPLNPIDPGAGNYYTSYDRGAGPVPGSNVWNTKTPDGQISGLDFFAVLGSFNSQGCDAGKAGAGFY